MWHTRGSSVRTAVVQRSLRRIRYRGACDMFGRWLARNAGTLDNLGYRFIVHRSRRRPRD